MRKTYILLSIVLISFSFVSLVSAETITDPLGGKNIGQVLASITKGVADIVGPLAGVMVIIAGIFFLTSGGSPERVNTAKACLMYAVIGAVIALSAGAISATITKIIGAP
ncbi:hypothetical protein KJ786_03745 [Patescibacteria group bacterium]|nr:hypothetical protein [Patescibacteria group bacterium]